MHSNPTVHSSIVHSSIRYVKNRTFKEGGRGTFPVPLPCMAAVSKASSGRFRPDFLTIEWDDMVDACQLDAWERDQALHPARM
jgi:hypothetical protein